MYITQHIKPLVESNNGVLRRIRPTCERKLW